MIEVTRPFMVTILCCTYNQKQYIRQCLDGFVMQQADFHFEAVVHDDASTDGTADVVREYAEKYPNIIKPILETENQYSKHDGSLDRIMYEHTHGKYIAVCEGDDYWIDPLKLQKQYDFMEAHPECTLCFHANYTLMPTQEKKVFRPKVIKNFYTCEDAISIGGSSIATNSMFYRSDLLKDRELPDFWKNCPIGDVPMFLFFASKGKIGYVDDLMSVYRSGVPGSWTSSQNTFKKRNRHYCAILRMYKEFDEFTEGQYHQAISKRVRMNTWRYRKSNFIFIVKKVLSVLGIKI